MYVSKQYCQNLFSIEPNRASISDPLKLAKSYFSQKFHWILDHGEKDLRYYSAILHFEKSILIKPIPNNANLSIIIYHSVLLLDIISKEKWGSSLAAIKMLPNSPIPYSYHDYITAWFRFMLHQDDNMTHSWFVNLIKISMLICLFGSAIDGPNLALLLKYFQDH